MPRPSLGLDLRAAHVLGGVRGDAAVDVSEPVEAARRREAPVDGGGCQSPLLEGSAVQLDVGSGRLQYGQTDVGGPLEERAEIVTVRIERSAAVASKERSGSKLRLIDQYLSLGCLDQHGRRLECRHGCPPVMGEPANTSPAAGAEPRTSLDPAYEVKRGDDEPFAHVEAVRIGALHPRIKIEHLAATLACTLAEMRE